MACVSVNAQSARSTKAFKNSLSTHLAISRSQLPKVLSGTTTATGPLVRPRLRATCTQRGSQCHVDELAMCECAFVMAGAAAGVWGPSGFVQMLKPPK